MTDKRTKQQNKAIHVYFKEVADVLNESGLEMKKVLKPEVEIPWTEQSIKDHIWRPIMRAMYGIESTTEMNPAMINGIYETIHRLLSQKFGIDIPFPSIDNVIELGYEKNTIEEEEQVNHSTPPWRM